MTWWRGVLPTYSDAELAKLKGLIEEVQARRSTEELLKQFTPGVRVVHISSRVGEGVVIPRPAGYPEAGASGDRLVWWMRGNGKFIGSYPWNLART